MAVDFTFDGSSTLTATFPATVGQEYELIVPNSGATPDDQIAGSSPLTLTVSDVPTGNPGYHFAAWVFDWDTSRVLASAILAEGTTNEFHQPGGSPSLTISAITYDGAGTASVTVTDPYFYHWHFDARDYSGFPLGSAIWTGDGTAQTQTATFSVTPGEDVVFVLEAVGVLEDKRTFVVGFADSQSTTVTQGSYTWNAGVTGSTNVSCEGAAVLTGTSGSVSADNSGWAGTWTVGGDPLFNYLGYGGGAPLWWKWTNPTADPLVFRAVITAGGISAFNAAVMVGTCGDLQILNDCSAPIEDNVSNSSGDTVDVIVPGGATVYLEVDSYTHSFTEPPDASAVEGSFSFTWSALSVTVTDGFTNALTILKSDISDGLYTTGTTGANVLDTWEIEDCIVANGRVFVAWRIAYHDTTSPSTPRKFNQLWAGSCLLDGSAWTSQLINEYEGGGIGIYAIPGAAAPDPSGESRARLVATSDDAFLFWTTVGLSHNLDRDCDDVTWPAEDSTSDGWALTWQVQVGRFSDSWGSFTTLTTRPSVILDGWQGFRVCLDAVGTAHVGMSYMWRRIEKHEILVDPNPSHSNRWACIRTDDELNDQFDRYSIDTATGSVTFLSSEVSIGNTQDMCQHGTVLSAVSSRMFDIQADHTDDPVMAWVKPTGVTATGTIRTNSFTDFASGGAGVPVTETLVDLSSVSRTYATDVTFELFTTGTAISTHPYVDFSGVTGTTQVETPPSAIANESSTLRLHAAFYNNETSRYERLVHTEWTNDTRYLNRCTADLSTLQQIDAAGSSNQSGITPTLDSIDVGLQTPLWDGLHGVWQYNNNAGDGAMWFYDRRCTQSWSAKYTTTGDIAQTQYGGWSGDFFYFTSTNESRRDIIRIGPIEHDYCVCAVGAEPTLQVGLYSWKRF